MTFSLPSPSWLLRNIIVVLKRMAKKCTKLYNARAKPLYCSFNLLFRDVLVAVAVGVCLNFLIVGGGKMRDPGNEVEETAVKSESNEGHCFQNFTVRTYLTV